MRFRLSLYEGNWRRKPLKQAIEELFADDYPFGSDCFLVGYDFVEPDEDVAVAIELTVATDWSDAEHVRDGIIEEFLDRFDPEYESMIEVETLECDDAC